MSRGGSILVSAEVIVDNDCARNTRGKAHARVQARICSRDDQAALVISIVTSHPFSAQPEGQFKASVEWKMIDIYIIPPFSYQSTLIFCHTKKYLQPSLLWLPLRIQVSVLLLQLHAVVKRHRFRCSDL